MAENLAFKGKLVWFGLDLFGLVWFGFGCCGPLRRSYLVYMPNLSSLGALCILQLILNYVDITTKMSYTHSSKHSSRISDFLKTPVVPTGVLKTNLYVSATTRITSKTSKVLIFGQVMYTFHICEI